jgi:hypothetical protein
MSFEPATFRMLLENPGRIEGCRFPTMKKPPGPCDGAVAGMSVGEMDSVRTMD